jgi:hypothetical protein
LYDETGKGVFVSGKYVKLRQLLPIVEMRFWLINGE